MNCDALGPLRAVPAAGALLVREGKEKHSQHHDATPPGTAENEQVWPWPCRNPPLSTKF